MNKIGFVQFCELVEELNMLQITQTEMSWEDNIPPILWGEYFKGNFTELKTGLEVDTRRWYETSISVINVGGHLLGIKHISNLFSETSNCEDICFTMQFFPMEEFTTVSYKRKYDETQNSETSK